MNGNSTDNASRMVGRIAGTFLTQVASAPLSLFLSVLIARGLGPEGQGRYGLAMVVATTMAAVLNVGLPAANVYWVSRGTYRLGTAAVVNLLLGVGLTACSVAVVGCVLLPLRERVLPGLRAEHLVWTTALVPLLLGQALLGSLLCAKHDFLHHNALTVAPALVAMVAVPVAVLVLGLGVSGVLGAMALGGFVALVVGLQFLRVHLRAEPCEWSGVRPFADEALKYGIKAHGSNLVSMLNYRVDVYMVGLLLSPAATGVLVIGVQIAERLWILSQASALVVFPRIAELHADDDLRRRITPPVARRTGLLTVIGALAIVVAGYPALRLLYGEAFVGAYCVIVILLPGIVMSSVSRVLSNDLAARGRPELNLYVALLALVANIVGNAALIPLWGISGAAAATSLTFALSALVKAVIYARVSGNSVASTMLPDRSDVAACHEQLRVWSVQMRARWRRRQYL